MFPKPFHFKEHFLQLVGVIVIASSYDEYYVGDRNDFGQMASAWAICIAPQLGETNTPRFMDAKQVNLL